MSESYQNEIPKARVNIALNIERDGAVEKKELPLKMIAIGDYSNGKGNGKVLNRQRINVHKNNLNQVLSDLAPELNLNVSNKINKQEGEMNVNLRFQSCDDFTPERIATQVPELKKLIAMRNLLKDLKSNLSDNTKFRQQLEKIIGDQPSFKQLRDELEKFVDAKLVGEGK